MTHLESIEMRKINYSFVFMMLLILAACSEHVDVEYAGAESTASAALSFGQYGFHTVELITTDETTTYEATITFKDTTLDLEMVVDTGALESYNALYDTEYKILPAEYYEMPETLVWSEENASLSIVFSTQKMMTDFGISAATSYVLPIAMEVDESVEADEQMTTVLLHVTISKPSVLVAQYEFEVAVDDTTQLTELGFQARYNVAAFDSDQLSVSINQSDVDSYNTANGTSYAILPSDNYQYTGITIDSEEKKLVFDFEVNAEGLDWTTYVLPMKISSDYYTVEGVDVFYYLITVNRTAPEYLATYTFSLAQQVTGDYSTSSIHFPLAEAAGLLGITQDELEASIAFYGVNSDETLYRDGYTANTGYWYINTGDVGFWGDEGCAMFVEYAGDSTFHIGQFPDAATPWDVYTVSMALVYEGTYIKYTFELHILPDYLDTYELSVTEAKDDNYATTAVTYDFSEVAALYGVTTDELSAGMSFLGLDQDDSYTTAYTANVGYWYDNAGGVTSWGSTGCTLFVEYGGDGQFNVGQFPDATSVGDSYTVTLLMAYNEQLVRFNITLDIE